MALKDPFYAVLLDRADLAKALSLRERDVDDLRQKGVIPFVRIPPRRIRYSLRHVVDALFRFEVKAPLKMDFFSCVDRLEGKKP
jgi:hypothetical protein